MEEGAEVVGFLGDGPVDFDAGSVDVVDVVCLVGVVVGVVVGFGAVEGREREAVVASCLVVLAAGAGE